MRHYTQTKTYANRSVLIPRQNLLTVKTRNNEMKTNNYNENIFPQIKKKKLIILLILLLLLSLLLLLLNFS